MGSSDTQHTLNSSKPPWVTRHILEKNEYRPQQRRRILSSRSHAKTQGCFRSSDTEMSFKHLTFDGDGNPKTTHNKRWNGPDKKPARTKSIYHLISIFVPN